MVVDAYKDIGLIPTCTIEECSELIKAICKADRFGWDTLIPGTNERNLDRVQSELEDVRYRIHQLEQFIREVEDRLAGI